MADNETQAALRKFFYAAVPAASDLEAEVRRLEAELVALEERRKANIVAVNEKWSGQVNYLRKVEKEQAQRIAELRKANEELREQARAGERARVAMFERLYRGMEAVSPENWDGDKDSPEPEHALRRTAAALEEIADTLEEFRKEPGHLPVEAKPATPPETEPAT